MLTGIFITFPAVIKGVANEFELNLSVLEADIITNKDSYFHNTNVWDKIIVTYETDQGGQSEQLEFFASNAQPKANFTVSSEARNIWQAQAVTIVDKDGGSIFYDRDELDTAYFDLDLT